MKAGSVYFDDCPNNISHLLKMDMLGIVALRIKMENVNMCHVKKTNVVIFYWNL
jgi:hypothetical protein